MKLSQLGPFFLGLISVGLTSCLKERVSPVYEEKPVINTPATPGLPPDPEEINGYLFSEYFTEHGFNEFRTIQLAAYFGDPADRLLRCYNHQTNESRSLLISNVLVGKVVFNGTGLNQSGRNYNKVLLIDSMYPAEDAKWSIDGNGAFKPFAVNLPRLAPEVAEFTSLDTVVISHGYTVVPGQLAKNYDSLSVLFFSGTEQPIVRTVAANVDTIIFSEKELATVLDNYTKCFIGIYTYNYLHMIVENKVYLFENSRKRKVLLNVKL